MQGMDSVTISKLTVTAARDSLLGKFERNEHVVTGSLFLYEPTLTPRLLFQINVGCKTGIIHYAILSIPKEMYLFVPDEDSRVSSVSIPTGLNGRRIGIQLFPAGPRDYSLLHSIGCGARPTSYSVDKGGTSPEVKRPAREADPSPLFSAEVKYMDEAIPPVSRASSGGGT
jgi:hypothetical protein